MAFPLPGPRSRRARAGGSRREAGGGQPRTGEGLGAAGSSHSPESLLPAECAALQKGNINIIIIILFI